MTDSLGHSPKLFTREEVDLLIPQIEEKLNRLRECLDLLEEYKSEMTVFQLMSASGPESDNPDKKKMDLAQSNAKDLVSEISLIQQELTAMGCVPKSYTDGLIDFFAEREGRLVFLCWKLGELSVTHWHSLDSGFAGRQPIETF